MAVMLAVAAAAGLTTMALVAAAFMGYRLSRVAGALERTLEADAPVTLRVGGHRLRAPAGPRLQRGELRVRQGRGARHERPPDRRPEPRDAPRDARHRDREGVAPLPRAERRLHRHRPLQADQRHLRPQDRRRGPAARRAAPVDLDPGRRHLRPLRRRGVHARSSPRRARRTRSASPRSCEPSSCTSHCTPWATTRFASRSASASPAVEARSSRSTCSSTGPMRPCTPPRPSAGTAPTCSETSTRVRRCAARRSRPSVGRRPPPSASGRATRRRRRWRRCSPRSPTTVADHRT